MTLGYQLRTAITGLKTNKFRSFLTILGIVIGIMAIIFLMSTGRAAQNLILNQIQGMGSKTIVVLPGREPKSPSDAAQLFSESLKEKDLTAIEKKANVPTLDTVMPVVFGAETAQYESDIYRLTIFGCTDAMQRLFDLYPDVGNFFTEEEIRAKASVVVIGSKVKEKLFGDGDALGKNIKIKGKSLRVIGILPQKGQVSFFNFDEVAMVPYTTAQQYIFGIKHFHRLFIQSISESTVNETASDIQTTLRESHNITDPEKDDFYIQTQVDLANRLGTITTALTLFLVAVASVSLIVAGIGIMNIMLVSVTERTREIGLRKALGATEKDILLQFLFESVVLTGFGGLTGIILGTIISFVASLIIGKIVGMGWEYSFPLAPTIIGLFVSVFVGLIFGIYPARKAAEKSPMEALRYE